MMVRARVSTGGRDFCGGEGRAQAHRDEHVEDLIGHDRNEWFHRPREKLRKRKRLGGVAAKRVGRLRRVEVRKDGLVEAQVGPARQEAEDGEEEGGKGEERRQCEDEHQAEVEEREARDTQGEDSAEESDGVGGDKLAEGDKEADLERDGAGDRG